MGTRYKRGDTVPLQSDLVQDDRRSTCERLITMPTANDVRYPWTLFVVPRAKQHGHWQRNADGIENPYNIWELSPISTTRVDGWPVSITRQHGPCWRARAFPLAELTGRVDDSKLSTAQLWHFGGTLVANEVKNCQINLFWSKNVVWVGWALYSCYYVAYLALKLFWATSLNDDHYDDNDDDDDDASAVTTRS